MSQYFFAELFCYVKIESTQGGLTNILYLQKNFVKSLLKKN